MTIRRYLYLSHRWLGICVAVLFVAWFASGMVMMYVGYPELTEPERVQRLEALEFDAVRFDLEHTAAAPERAGTMHGSAAAATAAGTTHGSAAAPTVAAAPHGSAAAPTATGAPLASARLTMVAGRPVYLLEDHEGALRAIAADTGGAIEVDEALAVASAEAFGGHQSRYSRAVEVDQWTLSSRLHPHRPLHRVEVLDGRGTVVYVSDASGEVVHHSTRTERALNWFGAIVHWIYPVQLRRYPDLWANVVIYVSVAGVLAVLTGLIVGFLRWRPRRRYHRGRDSTPYRGVMRWHHLIGITFGLIVFSFVFSGLMSMNPWNVFSRAAGPQTDLLAYGGGGLGVHDVQPLRLSETLMPFTGRVKEIEWRRVGDATVVVLTHSPVYPAIHRQAFLRYGDGFKLVRDVADESVLAARRLLPGTPIERVTRLEEYDAYYYSHHDRYRPLPMLRVELADDAGTWLHIDPKNGAILGRSDRGGRVARWLYNGLHSLDFPILINHRPLWDIVLLALSIIGLAFAVTSIIIGWRRLRM